MKYRAPFVLFLVAACGGAAASSDVVPIDEDLVDAGVAADAQYAADVGERNTDAGDDQADAQYADAGDEDLDVASDVTLDQADAQYIDAGDEDLDVAHHVDAHDAADASDAPVIDCPDVGCQCVSALGACSGPWPLSCYAGTQCCNWKAPGC